MISRHMPLTQEWVLSGCPPSATGRKLPLKILELTVLLSVGIVVISPQLSHMLEIKGADINKRGKEFQTEQTQAEGLVMETD